MVGDFAGAVGDRDVRSGDRAADQRAGDDAGAGRVGVRAGRSDVDTVEITAELKRVLIGRWPGPSRRRAQGPRLRHGPESSPNPAWAAIAAIVAMIW